MKHAQRPVRVTGSRRITVEGVVDLHRTLFPVRRGAGDPTCRFEASEVWRASRTPEGPATLRLEVIDPSTLEAEAFGPGGSWALEHAPALVGADDDASGFRPRHPAVAEAARRRPGVRITRTGEVLPVVLAAICEQKVAGERARRSWRGLVRATSEPAPGEAGLLLPPDPERVAALPSFALHRIELEGRRADVLRAICARAERIGEAASMPLPAARERLARFRGIGPWTVAEVARTALGDADAVSVGDFHVPNMIAWALAREARGTDERMLELLEVYRGHRGRVQRLLEAAGVHAPRYGPRAEIGSIASL